MTVVDLVKYLRLNVNIQNTEVTDNTYLNMTDADIQLYLEVVKTRDFPKVLSLDSLPTECVYPLVLLAKKELYFALASSTAPLFNITADNNNQLKRSDRFEHYMKLIAQVDSEYSEYIKDGGAGTRNTLTSYDVLLSNRYYTKRNYELSSVPVLSLYVDSYNTTTVDISWESSVNKFLSYKVYISQTLIHDEYSQTPINSGATLVSTITDPKKTKCRLEGLTSGTEYHILVSVTDRTTLTGYSEVTITTLV